VPSLGLIGPYSLNSEEIDINFPFNKPGNFALGYLDDSNVFIVEYVGRSDTDLNQILKTNLGKSYKYFKAKYIDNDKDRYDKECNNFHDFGEDKLLTNAAHPAPLQGTSYKCPVCDK